MTISKPTIGQQNWGPVLNATLDELDTEKLDSIIGNPEKVQLDGQPIDETVPKLSLVDGTAAVPRTSATEGWRYGIVLDTIFKDHVAFFRNIRNAAAAKGLYVETAFGAASGRAVEVFIGSTQEQFRIDGASDNPVWLRVGSTLKQVTAGANDSGGAGFKYLRVTN